MSPRSVRFIDLHPSPRPGLHVFSVSFDAEGNVCFGADTDSPAALQRRLEWLIDQFQRTPGLLRGACGDAAVPA